MFGRRINDRITKEGLHCDLCGSSSPVVRCEKCNSQIFCLSCDDMYHRHPKRNLHVRRALDAIMTNRASAQSQLRPPLPPKGETVPTPVPPPRKHKRFGFGKSPTPILGRREPSNGSLSMLNFSTIKKPDFSIREKVGSLKKLMGSRPLPPPPNDVPPHLKSVTLNRTQSERVRPTDSPPTPPPVSTIPRKNSLVEQNGMPHQSITEAAIPLTVVEMSHRDAPILGRRGSFRSVHSRSQMSDTSFSDTRSRTGGFFGGYSHQSSEEPSGRVMSHLDGWSGGRRRFGGGMSHSASVFDLSAAPTNPFPPPQPAFAPLSQAQSVAHLNCPSCRMMWMNNCHHHQHPAPMVANPWGYPQSYVSGDGTMHRTPSNMSMNIGHESMWGYPPPPPPGMMGMPGPRPSSPTQSTRSRRSSRPSRRRRFSSESDDYSASSEGEEPKPDLRSRRGSRARGGPWECKHCTFVNPETNTVCSVCCKTNVSENNVEKKQHKPARFNRHHERRRTIGIVPTSEVIKSNLSFNIKDKDQPDTKVHLRNESAPPPQSEDDSLGSRLEESLAFTASESAKQSSKTEEDTGEDLEQIPHDEEQKKSPVGVYTSRFMVNVNPSPATETDQIQSFYKAPLTASPNPDDPGSFIQDINSVPSPETQPLSTQSLEVPCETKVSVETPLTNGEIQNSSPINVDQGVPVNNAVSSPEQQAVIPNGFPEPAPATHTIAVGPSEAVVSPQSVSVGPSEPASAVMSHSIAVGPSPEREKSPVKTAPTSVSTSTSPLLPPKIITPSVSPQTLRKPVENEKKLISTGTSPPPQTIATQTTDTSYGSLDRRRRPGWGSNIKRAASFSISNRWDRDERRGMMHSGSQSQLDSPSSRECTPPSISYSRWNSNRRELPDLRHGTDSVESSGYGSHGSYSQLRLEDQRLEPVRNNKKDYYLSLEELVQRRKQEAMQKQGLELVRFLREAEEQGYTPEDLQIALNHCGDKTPIRWLMDNLPKMVDTVVTLATNLGHDKGGENDIGTISQSEAREALRSTKGNVWAAVTEGVELRKRKFKEVQARGDFPRDEITKALSNTDGNVEEALAELNRNQLKPFLLKIWGPPMGTENQAAATGLPTQPVPPEPDKSNEIQDEKKDVAEVTTSGSLSPVSFDKLKSSSSEREEEVPPVPATTPEVYVTPPPPVSPVSPAPEAAVKPKKVFQTKEAKEQAEFERKVRRLLAEGDVQDFRQGEVAVRLMALDLGHSNEDIFEAVKQCGNLDGAISYLEQECGICMVKVPEKKMIAMLMCEHRCCEECARRHFSYRITDRPIQEISCPFCAEPNLWQDEGDISSDYYNNLDILLKALVEPKVHELFHSKVTENALMKDPCFRWCGKCSNGMLMANPKQRRLECAYCKEVTCGDCQKPWEKQHDGISCEMFQEWKQANDPEFNAVGVAKQLADNGIQCPNCKFKFLLAKGGCLHFTCSQCHYEFCSACGKPFRMGARCNFGPYCDKLGLHAHHPRNCFFYLRDKEIVDLQKLLDQHNVPYKTVDNVEGQEGDVKCPVIEQKDGADKLEDVMCGKPVEQAGLCRLHYAEYLSSLISRHKLDPIDILSADDLEVVLRRANKALPRRSIGEAPELVKKNLLIAIRENVPLDT